MGLAPHAGRGGGCLAGHGDDDFSPATNEQILERLKNGNYPNYKQTMIDELARIQANNQVNTDMALERILQGQ